VIEIQLPFCSEHDSAIILKLSISCNF